MGAPGAERARPAGRERDEDQQADEPEPEARESARRHGARLSPCGGCEGAPADDTQSSCGSLQPAAMRLDPHTHAFVQATAFLTSLTFAIFATQLIALILERVLG